MPQVALSSTLATDLRARLPEVAEQVVAAIIEEVPSYTDAFAGPMGHSIRQAVQLALGGFLTLTNRDGDLGRRTPAGPAVEGAYQVGRGEARSGRSTDAILAAYRIGARVSWREMSTAMVAQRVPGAVLVDFAELVFAYIDELSAASVAGHTDETDTTGRVRQRLLERIAVLLLERASPDDVTTAAERAGWPAPVTLTAVLVPQAQLRAVLSDLVAVASDRRGATLIQVTDVPGLDAGLDGDVLLLVPDVDGRRRTTLLAALGDRGSVAGPAVGWLEARSSYDRCLRARALALDTDTEAHLPALVLHADDRALADLRARVLAPLDDLRPGTREKLIETLRAWLLHLGRREEVAGALFVHPQTVRYRMGQLRELFGDDLDDPDTVLALTLALA